MNKGQLLEQVFAHYESLQKQRKAEYLLRLDEARKNSDFRALDDKIRDLEFEIAKKEVSGKDCKAEISSLATTEKSLKKVMAEMGLPANFFSVKPQCSICGDTGRTPSGELCVCFKRLYSEKLKQAAGLLVNADFKFSDCDFSVFKNPEHRTSMEKLYKRAHEYSDRFPPKKYKNFLILGNTGTGKTCVASAIANAVLDKGYTVMFLTAFDFTRLMTKYHTTPISDRGIYIEDILSSDLLVLDDLGSEQRIRNVTVEYLFRVLSTRQNHGKCTVYTSNLSLKDGSLKDFYGDRVFSRLVDKNNTFVFEFDGEDVRQ